MEPGERGTSRHASNALLLLWSGLLVGASAWSAIEFTRAGSGRIATIWMANAILLTLLIRKPTKAWSFVVGGGLIGDVLANAFAGDTLPLSLGLGACNIVEVLLVAVPLRRLFSRHLDLSRLTHLGAFAAVAGLVAPGLAAAAAGLLMRVETSAAPLEVWTKWYRADALGYLLLTPLLLMLRLDEVKTLLRPDKRYTTLGWALALATVTALVFSQNTFPLLFLPVSVLGFIAVQLGAPGTALGIGFVAIVAVVATETGHGPMMLVPGGLETRILVLQAFIAVTVLAKLPLNAILSDRDRFQREAREANRRSQLAEQITQIGHWSMNLATQEITWSDGVFRIHGLDPATHTPTLATGIDSYHPDDRAKVTHWVQQTIEQTNEQDFSVRLIRSDGSVRDVIVRGLCERDQAGRAQVVFGTIIDVTDLRRAERAIVESEARYRLIAYNTTDMITQLDLDFRRVYVSPGSRALLGYEPDELIGRTTQEMIHPERVEEFDGIFTAFRAGEMEHAVLQGRLRHKDGTWVWVEASFKLLRDGDGAPSGFVVAVRNIAQRKLAHEALMQSEARYRLLADNASDLVVHGRDGRFLYMSPAVKSLLGYTVEEASGLSVYEDLARVQATARHLVAQGPSAALTYRLKHKDGHYLWVEVTFRRVEERDGGGVIAAVRDVTERVRQGRQLEEAKLAAEAGARIKAEFLANMSHELRTPLTGMLGVHDLLQSDPTLSDRQRRFVDLAQESGRSLLTIVNDILDFSKIEAGQMAIEQIPFSCRDLVESCQRLGGGNIKLSDVSLTAEVEADVPDLLIGDPTRLRQILLNLVTNAIKFTSVGRVSVIASWREDRLRIAVTDTGLGIKAETIPHLFERFSQADGSTTRRFGGTGLGLSICKSLVELMGGAIGVESTPGEGSTFWFIVPLTTAEPAIRTSQPSSPAATARTGRRILLAEDNTTNQEIISTMLGQNGHAVVLVADGLSAIRAVRNDRFDIVLMDVQMPGTDGLAASKAIRAWETAEKRTRLPIIALTANAMAEDTQPCRDAGMDAHVAKPIDWPELFDVIDRLCNGAELVGAVRARAVGEPSSSSAILDENALAELSGFLGRDTIALLLTSFRQDLERRLALLDDAETTLDDLCQHAHALMAVAGQLGFKELADICGSIERLGPSSDARDRLPTLRAIADRALNAATGSSYAKAA